MSPFQVSALTFLLLTILCCVRGHDQTYDNECHFATNHCNRTAGLYCNNENGVCECNQGLFDTKYNFSLTWNPTVGKCLGILGSICLGTEENPVTLSQECNDELECIQLEGYVPSVGVCSTPSATEKPTSESPTTPSSVNGLTSSSSILLLTLFISHLY